GPADRVRVVRVGGSLIALLDRSAHEAVAAGRVPAGVEARVGVALVAVVALLGALDGAVAAARRGLRVRALVGALVARVGGTGVGVGAVARRAGGTIPCCALVVHGAEQTVVARRVVGFVRVIADPAAVADVVGTEAAVVAAGGAGRIEAVVGGF